MIIYISMQQVWVKTFWSGTLIKNIKLIYLNLLMHKEMEYMICRFVGGILQEKVCLWTCNKQ